MESILIDSNNYINRNKDDITEAVHGLDIFTKNWCMNCKETEVWNAPMFMCTECEFRRDNGVCMVKEFARKHNHDYPLSDFGSMGSH